MKQTEQARKAHFLLLRSLKPMLSSNVAKKLRLMNSWRFVASVLMLTKCRARSSFAQSYLKISSAKCSGVCW